MQVRVLYIHTNTVNYDIMAYRYLIMKVNISASHSAVIQTVMMGKDRLFCMQFIF